MPIAYAHPKIRFVVLGGVIAATLDILFAFVFYGAKGISPASILQSISSGLLGADAYQGGMGTVALGLALHFFIATAAAFVFYIASRWLMILVRYPLLSGIAFGVCIYIFMNYLVLPLSAFPHRASFSLTVLLVHMFLVGIPIALGTKMAIRNS